MNFQIKKGLRSNLFDIDGNCLITEDLEEGCWYLTIDTVEVFVAVYVNDVLTLKQLNEFNIEHDFDFEEFDSRLKALENEEKVHTYGYRQSFPQYGSQGHIYVAVDLAQTFVWYNGEYIPMQGESEAPDIIFGGTAD